MTVGSSGRRRFLCMQLSLETNLSTLRNDQQSHMTTENATTEQPAKLNSKSFETAFLLS
jgi:hypothetical protein